MPAGSSVHADDTASGAGGPEARAHLLLTPRASSSSGRGRRAYGPGPSAPLWGNGRSSQTTEARAPRTQHQSHQQIYRIKNGNCHLSSPPKPQAPFSEAGLCLPLVRPSRTPRTPSGGGGPCTSTHAPRRSAAPAAPTAEPTRGPTEVSVASEGTSFYSRTFRARANKMSWITWALTRRGFRHPRTAFSTLSANWAAQSLYGNKIKS